MNKTKPTFNTSNWTNLHKIGFTIFIWLIACFIYPVYAQHSITGIITDKTTGESLIGVNIIIKGEKIGTASDINGRFTLNIPSTDSELVISYMGYITKYIKISDKKNFRIEMEPDNKVLNEIVVVGYGTQKKKQLSEL